MSWISLEEARSMLNGWLEAEKAVMTGKSYKIGTRSLTRNNVAEIADRIKYWRNEVEKLENSNGTGSGARVFRAVPRDW